MRHPDNLHQADGGSDRVSSGKPLISVVVPCFNEQDVLPLTHQRLIEVLGNRQDFDVEIVYVDDGSADATPQILDRLIAADDRIVVVSLTRNFGHQAAITAGLQYATGDAVAVIDADLQDPPELIPTMIEKWRSGFEVVYAVRARRQEFWLKRASYAAFYRILRACAQIEIPVDSGDFALMDRRAVDILNSLPERNRFVRGLRAWIGFRQAGVPYDRPARAAGETKYSTRQLVKLAFNGVFSLSSRPLTFIFVLGVITALGAVVGAMLYLTWYVSGIQIFGQAPRDAPGFTSIVLLLLLSGLQLISLGIIGEYVGRIYDEAKQRPPYLSRRVRSGKARQIAAEQSVRDDGETVRDVRGTIDSQSRPR